MQIFIRFPPTLTFSIPRARNIRFFIFLYFLSLFESRSFVAVDSSSNMKYFYREHVDGRAILFPSKRHFSATSTKIGEKGRREMEIDVWI